MIKSPHCRDEKISFDVENQGVKSYLIWNHTTTQNQGKHSHET